MWNLLFEGLQQHFSQGPDQAEYEAAKPRVLNKYINNPNTKCLQVGVNQPYTQKFAPHFTAIDKYDQRQCIDLRCDLLDLPFENGRFDYAVCNAILEHVTDPFTAASELQRVMKPGAEIWCEVPFAQPFHPTKKWTYTDGYMLDTYGDPKLPADENHGGDFWRFTPQGIAVMFKQVRPVRFYIAHAGGIAFHGIRK